MLVKKKKIIFILSIIIVSSMLIKELDASNFLDINFVKKIKDTNKIREVDIEAPTLNVDDNAFIDSGNPKTDQELKELFNVSAIDSIDGDVTDKIIVDQSKVDYNNPGTYTVNFSVSDNSNNKINKDANLTIYVDVPDANLKAALNQEYNTRYGTNRLDDQGLTVDELNEFTGELILSSKGIADTKGLEYVKNISALDISRNKIEDISFLYDMHLDSLRASMNEIEDIKPMESQTDISFVSLSRNNIKDVSPLSKINYLDGCNVEENQITDLSPIKDLKGSSFRFFNQSVAFDDSNSEFNHKGFPDFSVYNKSGQEIKINNYEKVKGTDNYQGTWYSGTFSGKITLENYHYEENERLDPIINMPDDVLRKNINTLYLHQAPDADITKSQMETITPQIFIFDEDIKDITGLQYATNVEEISISYGSITDLSPLKGMNNLKKLDITGNKITDISPLEEIPNLESLVLNRNEISNINSIGKLSNLNKLYLAYNPITNIEPLKDLTQLKELSLDYDNISSISPLSLLTNLECLSLDSTNISSINELSSLVNLTYLSLSDNQIIDLTPLNGLSKLEKLYLSNNKIDTIDTIGNLTNMKDLYLNDNKIKDISSLSNLTFLKEISLARNQITDLSPLKDLTSIIDSDYTSQKINEVNPISNTSSAAFKFPIIDIDGTEINLDLGDLKEGTNTYKASFDNTKGFTGNVNYTFTYNPLENSDEKPTITSDDKVSIQYDDIKTDEELIDLFNVNAFDFEDRNLNDKIVVDQSAVKYNIPGTYDIKFSVIDEKGNSSEKTSQIEILKTHPIISADDIYTNEETLKNETDINEFLLNNANINVSETTKTLNDVSIKDTDLTLNSKTGIYSATFEVSNTLSEVASKSIKIYVANGSDIIDDDKPYLFADDLKVKKDSTINNTDYKAVAFDKQDGDLSSSIVYPTVDTSKAGVFEAKLEVSDKDTNKIELIKHVTVTDDSSVVSPDDKVMLNADNIYTNIDSVSSSSDINDFILSESNSFAKNIVDGSDVDVTVDSTTLKKDSIVGAYKATLSATSGKSTVSKDIDIYVANGSDIIDDDKPYLFADDLKIKKDSTINNTDYKAVAFDKQDGDLSSSIVYPTVDTSKAGVFEAKLEVTDKDTNKTELIKHVTVTDDSSVVSPDDKVMLNADNIYTNIDSISSSSDINDFILSESNSFAKNIVDGSDVNVTVDSTTLKKDSIVGAYKATLSATSGKSTVSKDIDIYVANGSDIIDDDKPYLFANDISVGVGSNIDNSLYGAVAFDKDDGDLTSSINYPTVDTSILGKKVAKLSVSDKSGNNSEMSVNVDVIDNNKPVIVAIDSSEIEVKSTLTSDEAKKLFEVSVSDNVDHLTVDDVSVDMSGVDLNIVGTYDIVFSVSDNSGNSTTKTSKLNVIDDEVPIINSLDKVNIKAKNPLSADELKSLFKVSANDNYDGDITSDVVVDQTKVNYDVPGIYDVVFSIIDSNGNRADKKVFLKILSNEPPVLKGVEDIEVIDGSDFNPMEGVIAIDKEDGDISNNIEVYSKDLKDGLTQVYNYSIEDSDGNKVEVNRTVKYVSVTNNKPVINGIDNTNIFVGEDFDPMDGVSASDIEDGDLTSSISISGSVNNNVIGDYTLTYTVVDSDNNTVSIDRIITVKDIVVITNNKPIISGANDVKVKLGSDFDIMKGISASDVEDGDITSLISVNGKVNTSIVGDYTLTYSVVDSDNNKVKVNRTISVYDDENNVINNIDDNDNNNNSVNNNPSSSKNLISTGKSSIYFLVVSFLSFVTYFIKIKKYR